MNLEDYARHDGLGLAALVRKREVSPRELCRLALDGVAAVNPRLNAVIETFPERLPASDDVPPGPFAGVPFLVKDFPIEAGVRGEMGSRLAAGFAPDRDSEIMTRLRAAGFNFYDWTDGAPGTIHLVLAFNTDPADAEAFVTVATQLAAAAA